ncbi:hypothetical protein NE619_00755 [Anaerovorax odorimutans]|uniref:SGNH/GDSL hydrolase family protein n=1 Tax=Anaerovorax odorimutans TaxID=109327 RepID=A0ABT1RJA2_9FIRM|nr:hypothetical protein [Anaerovorax odorimutans]MCQ4635260.1 hypothetical protein [Anaerovorax odorimutans]
MTKRDGVRSIIFLLICLIAFVGLNKSFSLSQSDENRRVLNTFYAEKENSLDGIYLGSSAANRFWNAPLAYNETGIAVFDLATSGQPMVLYKYLIEEAEKTQDPKVYIMELREVTESLDKIEEVGIRRATDSMHFNLNRIKAINAAVDYAEGWDNGVDTEKLNYYFPIIKYHGRWQGGDLTTKDLLQLNRMQETKGFFVSKARSLKQEPQKPPVYTTQTEPLYKEAEELLNDLMDYCDTLDAEVLFVFSPYSEQVAEEVGRINQTVKLVQERGYEVINFNTKEMNEELGIDWSKDCYDPRHLNMLGSEKYTKYLAEYLAEHYDLPDHRGDKDYESWDEAYDFYAEFEAKNRGVMQE